MNITDKICNHNSLLNRVCCHLLKMFVKKHLPINIKPFNLILWIFQNIFIANLYKKKKKVVKLVISVPFKVRLPRWDFPRRKVVSIDVHNRSSLPISYTVVIIQDQWYTFKNTWIVSFESDGLRTIVTTVFNV